MSKKTPRVLVEWIDSTFYKFSSEWQSLAEVRDSTRGPLPTCETIGHVVHQDQHGLTIALSRTSGGLFSEMIKVPWFAVVGVWDLKRGRRRKRRKGRI